MCADVRIVSFLGFMMYPTVYTDMSILCASLKRFVSRFSGNWTYI
jgi:hypothetical protein